MEPLRRRERAAIKSFLCWINQQLLLVIFRWGDISGTWKCHQVRWVIPLVRHFISFHLLEETGEFIFMTLENEAAKQLLLLPPVSCEKHKIVVCACDSCAKVHSRLIKRPTVHFIDMSSMCDCRAQGLYRASCQAQLRYFQNRSFCEYLASTFLLPLQTSAHSGRSGRRSGGNACLQPVEEEKRRTSWGSKTISRVRRDNTGGKWSTTVLLLFF